VERELFADKPYTHRRRRGRGVEAVPGRGLFGRDR
jgi:hypothetical protein